MWLDITQVDDDNDEATTRGRSLFQGEGALRNDPCKVRSWYPPVIDLNAREEKRNWYYLQGWCKVLRSSFPHPCLWLSCTGEVFCFCANVKRKNSAWVKDPAEIDIGNLIYDTTNLYTNYKSTGEWYEETIYKDAFIFSLETELKKKRENKNTAADRPGENGSRKECGDGPADWKFINKGATMNLLNDVEKYV